MNITLIICYKILLIVLLFHQDIVDCNLNGNLKARQTNSATSSNGTHHSRKKNRNNSNNSSPTSGTTGDSSSPNGTSGSGVKSGGNQDQSGSQGTSVTLDQDQSKGTSEGAATITEPKKPDEIQAIELDLKDKDSTSSYDCLKKDGFAKYTAKNGYGFASVVGKVGGCSGCCGSNIRIWNTTDPNKYATKVVRDGTGTCKNLNNVTIFFGDKYRHFTKSNKKFVEDSGFRLYQNDTSKPDKKKQLKNKEYTEERSEDLHKISINDGIQCTVYKYVYRYFQANSAKLIAEEVLLWKHDSARHGDQYPYGLRYYWFDRILINFPNIFVVYYRKEDKKWDDGHQFDFKLYGKNEDNSLKALDLKSYELTPNEKEYVFKFNLDNKCEVIKHRGEELWKHDPNTHGDKYPLTLRYKKDGSSIYMDFEGFFVYCYRGPEKKFKAKEFYIHLYTMDPVTEELKELDFPEYDMVEDYEEFEFKFNQGRVCDNVMFKGVNIWSYDPIVYHNEHPSSVYFKDSRIIVNFEHYFLLYDKDAQDNWKGVELDIKLHGANPQDATKSIELPMTKYEITKEGRDYHFKLKEGVQCTNVKHKGHQLWKYVQDKYGDKYPNLLIYNKPTGKLILNYEHMVVFNHKDEKGEWQTNHINVQLMRADPDDNSKNVNIHCNNYHLSHNKDEYEFVFKENIKPTSVKLEGQDVWSHDTNKYGGKHPKQVNYRKDGSSLMMDFDGIYVLLQKNSAGKWDPLESITLDITSTSTDNAQYECVDKTYHRVFTPKTGFLFGRIDIANVNIYQSDDFNNCSNKVVIRKNADSEIEEVSVILFNGDFKRYNKLEGTDTWYQRLKSLFLDVKMRYNSYYYNYYISRDMDTYVAKNNFGFKRVRYGLLKVWETDHESTYASKVTYYRSNGEAEIEIKMYNGETRIFTVKRAAYTDLKPFPGPSYPVAMIEQTEQEVSTPKGVPGLRPSPDQIDRTKLKVTYEETETSDEDSYETKEEPPVELPSSIKITTEGIAYVNAINQFKVYKWTKNNCDFYKVEFDDEVKCTNVEVDNSTIWKYAGGYRIPLTILYEPNASLLLKFYDGYLKYDKAANTNKWISECDIKLYTTDPFDITKTIKLNDTQYTTTKEGSQYSFVFQPGVECDEVRFVEKKPDKNDFRRINVTFKTVWKRWSLFGFESPTNDYFPTAIKYKNRSRVILVFPNGILIRERDMNNDWHTLIDEIKMYTFHPKNPDEIIEMDHSHFLNKTLDGPIHFEFKPKVKCVKVKVDDEVLWTPEHRSTPNRYPTELNYGKYISRLTLRFDSSSLVFFKLRGDWTSYTKENETDVNCLSSTVDMDGFSTVWPLTGSPRNQVPQSISTDFYSFGIGWDTFGEFIDQEVYNTNDPWSFPTGWHTYDYGGVEREPKPQKNALEHLISDIDFIDSSDTRTPISSSSRQIERLPIQIVDGVNRVVRAKRQRGIVTVEDPSAHAPEGGVSTDVDDIPFTHHELIDLILNMNEELERLKKDYSDLRQQLETASTQGKRIPITLDISVKESTNQVTCSKEGVNVVFTPLLPYTFKMIKRSQMVIWHTLRPTEYSVKVVLTPNDKVIVHRVDEKREEMEIKAKNEQVLILNDNTPPLKGLYDDEELEMESNFIMGLRRAESFTSLNDGVRKTDHLVKNDSEGAASDSSVGSLDFFDIDLVDSVVERRPNEFRGQQPKNSEHLDDGERLLIQYIEQTQQPQQSKMAQTAEPLPIETQEPRELQIQLIILELTDRRSSEYVTYEANHIKRREKFTCIPPYRVLRVVHNGQLVWSSSNENYPDRVLVKPGEDGNPMAYMFLPGDFVESVDDGPDVEQVEQLQSLAQDSTPVQEKLEQLQQQQLQQQQQYQQQLQQQQEEEPGCYTLITVHIDQLKSTSDVTYEFDQAKDIHRFVARDWCLIEKVMMGEKVIWEPKTEYGIEVEIKFAKTQGEKDSLIVYFPSEEENAQKKNKSPSQA
ncbi:uncharacterized protein TOT_020000857 [Theileria orientalis strain Shintoku]|uniref:Uncharacterized protein n=1 Tax=Theileria orientalis strain Shintoku TaxID=869250 RepID=J4CD65_THEOR|nr:uncharacterized protein TOT_020000857 [Theileria orientalis strain Shintoku]BAM40602.1 uncharacterized protein TOT_020000857 [Theileria orientalis strain Shintoku]|eukprot:XP_009690903.1 uncharacterized protein TOT_020000857 [Theileria orientalis strain Shintoku]